MNIGLLGFGTIGHGVVQIINNLKKTYDINLVHVFDLPDKKEVLKDLLVTNVLDIIDDASIDLVIEALGGHDFAYGAIKRALQNKKHVITANKEVVSMHIAELSNIARCNNVLFFYEASVGGGIPIIRSLEENILMNPINHIYGILNGTTNFILSKMQNEGMDFQDALKLAQKLGFAERDPRADLEGLDMVRKISILSSLSYMGEVNNDDIYHFGITNITKEFIDEANKRGYLVKFISESWKRDNNIIIRVEPVLIKRDHPLASVNNEFNAVYFFGETNDTLGFYGKGAGSLPTASAIGLDILSVLRQKDYTCFRNINKLMVNQSKFTFRAFYKEDGIYKFGTPKENVFYARMLEEGNDERI